MKSTFTILFYLRKNRVNENGEAPIMSCITINGEKAQFSTKLQTHPHTLGTKNRKMRRTFI
ncbi:MULTISPECIES: Arm DNA-binding domain-containing protein [Dysgonomonas]|uniref:Arm DNA-binding domain-containing protein n=1 Tax=Dysgonomonas TaxID=156973 RepID=UPI00040202D8|nr:MULTISPECIES: Arm DNA-binding domain-containing protein [Dysgonomonas]MBS7119800.1 hypothetical protein [Dysgonomonas sp.]